MISFIKKKFSGLAKYDFINKLAPKFFRVLVVGNNGLESNAIELANYLSNHYAIKVYFAVASQFHENIHKVLGKNVCVIPYGGRKFLYYFLTSKYVFATHNWGAAANGSKRQVYVNVWHGASYKKLRIARGESGIPADYTLATSDIAKKAFHEFFGVGLQSIIISGYPRNDMMLRVKRNKKKYIKQSRWLLEKYNNVLVWMPTFRRPEKSNGNFEVELINAFNIPDFDVERFNKVLEDSNSICLLKLHYFYNDKISFEQYNNIKIVKDKELLQDGLTLYQLLGLSDILITDFSSVQIDYSLLDQPVICFSKDLEQFKETQGLYFEDIENWLPSKLIEEEEKFFRQLIFLIDGNMIDEHSEKREKVRKTFFKYEDERGSERLIKKVFKGEVKRLS